MGDTETITDVQCTPPLHKDRPRTLSDVEYHRLFQDIREGFCVGEIVRDDEGRPVDFIYLEVNDAFTRQTGLSAHAALGRRVTEAIPGIQTEIIKIYGKVVDTGEPAAFETEIPALAHRSYEARVHPLGGERFAVLFLEITERKRMEKALEESRAMLSDIIETVDQIVWSTGPNGYHDFFNRRWYEFTGTEPGATEGYAWTSLFHPDDIDRTLERWHHSLETGEPYEIEYRVLHHSGEYRWLLGRAHPVRNEAGEIIRWMGTCTDIDEKHKQEEFQALLIREISHRVKNSLALVSALLNLQSRTLRDGPRAALEDSASRVQAVATVHDQLFRHANAREVDVEPFLSNLAAAIATTAPETETIVDVEPERVPADTAVPMGLLVNELLTNAYKYAYARGEKGEVRVKGEHTDPARYRIEVSDHGVGLPEGFDIANAGESLGMKVITTLTKQLDGHIEVGSAQPGARFAIDFPIRRSPAELA